MVYQVTTTQTKMHYNHLVFVVTKRHNGMSVSCGFILKLDTKHEHAPKMGVLFCFDID